MIHNNHNTSMNISSANMIQPIRCGLSRSCHSGGSCCSLSVDGQIHDISNLTAVKKSLYPVKADARRVASYSFPTLPKKTHGRNRRSRAPLAASSSRASLQDSHDGKRYMDVGQNRIMPFFDSSATMTAFAKKWYTTTACQDCEASLVCIYGLDFVLCATCQATTQLEYDAIQEGSSRIEPFGVGLGLPKSHILQALRSSGNASQQNTRNMDISSSSSPPSAA